MLLFNNIGIPKILLNNFRNPVFPESSACRRLFYKRFVTVLLVVILFLFLIPTAGVYALKFSPARYEIVLKPGEKIKVEYTVTNNRTSDITLKTSHRDWFVYEKNKNIKSSDWIEINPNKFFLKPGESKKIICKIKVPKDAEGFLCAMVSFTPEEKTGGMITLILSSALYVIVDGTQKVIPEFTEIGISTYTKVDFSIYNRGNIYIRPSGKITIKRKGKVIAKGSFNKDKPLWPGRKMGFQMNFSRKLADGNYNVVFEIYAWNKKTEEVYKLKIKNNRVVLLKQK